MELKESEQKALERRGITSDYLLRRLFPYKYMDYTKISPLSKELDGENVAIKGKLLKYNVKELSKKNYMTTATIMSDGFFVNLCWFHNVWIGRMLEPLLQTQVMAFGKITYNEQYKNFNMVNAEINPYDEDKLCVQTVYTSMKGLKDDKLRELIDEALLFEEDEYIPSDIVRQISLLSEKEAIRILHKPKNIMDIQKAEARFLFDDMLYFATKIEEENVFTPKGTIYQANTRRLMDTYINSLPYSLTNAQKDTIEKIYELMKDARCVNALVQGDVGCGKTTVAIATLLLMAENGYQSVLMTPTVTLGNQHYEEIKEVCDKLGISVAFYGGSLKAKEKKALKENVENGNIKIVVGTQGVTNLSFKNLALIVADEEHKYGVEQREKLMSAGVHTVTMSATPIPRTIATTIYGDKKEIYTINELPSNRKPIKTVCTTNDKAILNGVKCELKNGHQVYVVCPLVKESDSEKLADVKNVEEVYEFYKKSFPEYNVEVVTGKMKKEDVEDAMARFKKNESQILVATSVIEVGISVPNATAIIIYNAERFGIAELHQLRGRVGRGSLQSFCILHCENENNVRVSKMCETTDGFEIAKADLEQRGMGDILGKEQSGRNHFLEQALKYPKQFKFCRDLATKMIAEKDYKKFLSEYELRNGI